MAILQEPNAVFYHPLDDATEALQAQAWDGSPGFTTAKVSLGMEDQATIGAFGALAKFQPSAPGISSVSTARLGPTTFVVAYRNDQDSNSGWARVATVSGTDVTYGNQTQFSAANPTNNISVATLDPTMFVVAYENVSTNEVKIGTVTGASIAFDSATVYSVDAVFSTTSVIALEPSKFVVAWSNAAGRGTARVGTVVGTIIAFAGAEKDFLASGIADDVSATALSASKFVVAYSDGADSNHGTVKVGSVSGTDITFGAEAEFLSVGSSIRNSIAALSSTTFVAAYADLADSGHLTAKVGTVSGTAVTFGAESEFVSTTATSPDLGISVAVLRESQFAVAYTNVAATAERSRVGTVVGTAIAFGAEAELMTGAKTATISAVALGPFKYAVAYADESSSAHGTAKANDLAHGASVNLPSGLSGLTVESEFAPLNVNQPRVAALSATQVVAVYNDTTNFQNIMAKVGTVNGADITWSGGSWVTSTSTTPGPDYLSVSAMTTTKFVVAYRNQPNADHGAAKIGTVSGGQITMGAEAEFHSGAAALVSALGLSPTQFVVAYRDADDTSKGKANVGSVAGSTISFGAAAIFVGGAGVNSNTSMSALSSSQFALAYASAPFATGGTVKIGTVSGALVTFGARTQFSVGSAAEISVATLSATKIVVAYQDSSDGQKGKAQVGTVSGAAVTFGAAAAFLDPGSAQSAWVAALDATRFVVVWYDSADLGRCAARVGTVSGTTVAFPDPDLAFGAGTDVTVAAIDSTDFVVGFQDSNDLQHGTAFAGTHRPNLYPTAVGAARLAFSAWMQDSPPNVTAAPVVTGPLFEGDTTVSGTSTEADGTLIQVYTSGGGVPEGAPVLVSSGAWTRAGLAPLSAGEGVGAKATAAGKLESPLSAIETAVTLVGGGKVLSAVPSAGNTTEIKVAMLSSTKFIATYNVQGSTAPRTPGNHVLVGTVSGQTITYGAETRFTSGGGETHIDIVALSTGTAVVSSGTNAYVCTIAGTVVTVGAANALPETGTFIALDKLDASKFVLCGNLTALAKAVIGTVGGTLITWGATIGASPGGAAKDVAVATLDSGKFVIAWVPFGAGFVWTQIGTVSFTTISFGTEVAATTEPGPHIATADVTALDAATFAVAWYDSNDRFAAVRAGLVAFSAISLGPQVTFAGVYSVAQAMGEFEVCALDSTRFLLGWSETGTPKRQVSRAGAVAGAVISLHNEVELWAAGVLTAAGDFDLACLDATKAVAAWTTGGSNSGALSIVREVL